MRLSRNVRRLCSARCAMQDFIHRIGHGRHASFVVRALVPEIDLPPRCVGDAFATQKRIYLGIAHAHFCFVGLPLPQSGAGRFVAYGLRHAQQLRQCIDLLFAQPQQGRYIHAAIMKTFKLEEIDS